MFHGQSGGFLLFQVDYPFPTQGIPGGNGLTAGGKLRGKGEPEGRALAKFTLKPDLAPHLLDQALRDGQPKAGATVLSGSRSVGLAEGVEQGLLLGPGEAHAGIRDAQAQGHPVGVCLFLFQARPQDHLAGLGKLDGVVDQVGDHLFDPQGVTHDVIWHIVVDQRHQIQVLGMGGRRQHDHDFLDNIPQLEGHPVQNQLAGFNF